MDTNLPKFRASIAFRQIELPFPRGIGNLSTQRETPRANVTYIMPRSRGARRLISCNTDADMTRIRATAILILDKRWQRTAWLHSDSQNFIAEQPLEGRAGSSQSLGLTL
eukprot:4540532-Pleurochrysis_carterae.AAC.1